MKRLFLTGITLILILGACQGAQDSVPMVTDYDITVNVDPDPPGVGESQVMVSVMDKDGNLVDGALIRVSGNMDHEGMQPVSAESEEQNDDGVYVVPFVWSMGGNWILEIEVVLADNTGRATKSIDVFVEALSQDSIINRSNEDSTDDSK